MVRTNMVVLWVVLGCGAGATPSSVPQVDPEAEQKLEAREMGRQPERELARRGRASSGAAADVAATVPRGTFTAFDGRIVNLADATRERGAVVVFYRGHWCKECREQLRELEGVRVPLDQRGYTVYGVSTDDAGTAAELRKRLSLGFDLLADPGGVAISAWGVYTAEHDLARPAVFVVAPGGQIVYRYVSDSPADRPSTQELLDRAITR